MATEFLFTVPCLRSAASVEEEYEATGGEVLLDNEDNDDNKHEEEENLPFNGGEEEKDIPNMAEYEEPDNLIETDPVEGKIRLMSRTVGNVPEGFLIAYNWHCGGFGLLKVSKLRFDKCSLCGCDNGILTLSFQVIIKNKMDQRDSIKFNDQQLEPKLEMAAIVQHDFMQINNPQPQVNDQQLEPKLEMAAIVQNDFMQINNPQPQPEAEPSVSMELIETYEHLKFDQQVEEQIKANIQQELQEFQQNMLWDEIAIHEIAIPWTTD
ncbi:hypothetical protein RHSIM_Rhsim12G0075300 [Rhododendron simsii]|uniref:Uncharacterized protein n=1 Tax=Rhododendron simsii TaxID=118357 RepID=A0A834G3U2_RHOSS|nr:hypothetical protein RHSIM_Rhsim12G0075300 [Rhododendron simsii]